VATTASVVLAAMGAAACGSDEGPRETTGVTVSPASGPTTEAATPTPAPPPTTADDVCRLVTFDEATAVLGSGTSADVTGAARCVYRRRNVAGVDREIHVEPATLPTYDYKSLDDFVRFQDSIVAKGNAQRIEGIGDAAYFNKLQAGITFLRGQDLIEITIVLTQNSADFDKDSDKSTERDTLIRFARNAVARL
jgi:hypothetical protein